MQESGLLYSGDDEGYFAQATSLAFFQFPDYSKEHFIAGVGQPQHSIGPGIMAFPFVFSFSLIDRLEHSPIVEQRNRNNIIGSWSLFGFVLSTIFYFYFGIIFLYKALKYYFDDKICFYSILFMILFQYFFLYVYRRPVYSHIYEFFLQSVLIYILIKDSKTKFLSNIKWQISILIGVIIGLVTLVRYNNLLFTLLWPIAFFCFKDNKFNLKNNWKKILVSYLFGILIVFLFKLIPLLIYKNEAYIEPLLMTLIIKNPLFYIKVFLNIIFGVDFGLVFSAPFLLIGIVCLFVLKFDFKKRFIIALIPIIINIFLVSSAGTQFGWYGYRLIFFSIIPFLVFPFALFLKNDRILCDLSISPDSKNTWHANDWSYVNAQFLVGLFPS